MQGNWIWSNSDSVRGGFLIFYVKIIGGSCSNKKGRCRNIANLIHINTGRPFFATKLLPHPAPAAEAKFLIGDKQRQLGAKTGLCEKANIDEEDLTGTTALSRFTSLGLVHSSDAIQTAQFYCYSSKGWEGLKLQMPLQDGAQKRGLTAA